MTDYEIAIVSGSRGNFCNITEQRTRTVVYQDTGETEEKPIGPHGSSISLGEFAIVDEKTGAITGYRDADYQAALLDKITPLVGKDHAGLLAAVALESAKVAQQKADLDAAVAAAQATLDAAAAVAVDVQPMPEPVQIAPVAEPLTP